MPLAQIMSSFLTRIRIGCVAALCCTLSIAAAVHAATPPAAHATGGAAVDTAESRTAPATPAQLVVFNRPIVTFRVPFLGSSPEERVRASQGRLSRFRENTSGLKVSQQSVQAGIMVTINDKLAFIITPGDVDALNGETLESTAAASVAALEKVIEETQELRSVEAVGKALVATAVAAAILLAVLWVLWRMRRWISTGLQTLAERQAARLRIGEAVLFQRDHALLIARRISNTLFTLVGLLLVYTWFDYVLQRFPYTRRWGEQLDGFMLGTAELLIDGMLDALPNLLIAILIFLIARFIARLLRGFFERVQSRNLQVGWLDADTAGPTSRIVGILVWVFALVMAYPYLPGASTDAFKGISVLLGLMVSIGASSTIGQAASGLILMYTRTIRVGEYVRIGDHEGTITELGMFTTRIRTGMGEELTLPNSMVVGTVTKNYSRGLGGHGFVLTTTVTIGYDAPWRQVHALLLAAADRTDGIVKDPLPRVYQTALSDFYVEYRLACLAVASDPRPRAEVLNVLHQNIQDVFNEHGVQIMSPHYLGDPAQAKVVPKDQWYAAPAQPPSAAGPR